MRAILYALAVSTSLSLVAISASPARAAGGDVAAGLIGGLAAGALLGATMGGPHYYPPPAYVAPEPVYGPRCYWAAGEPYWDDYSEVWTYQRVRVCE